MATPLASAMALSVSANSSSSDQVSTSKKFVGKGIIRLFCKPSATGMSVKLAVNGYPLVDSLPITWFGTTGTMSAFDNKLVEQAINGGAVELIFINTTGGALTTDYLLDFEATR